MTLEEFERLVAEAADGLPESIRKALDNVDFVIENQARRLKAREVGLRSGRRLLGLYEGIPLVDRGPDYVLAVPDKITIFKRPIEEEAGDEPGRLKEVAAEVVWHEVGHHLGYDDRELAAIERKRKKRGSRPWRCG